MKRSISKSKVAQLNRGIRKLGRRILGLTMLAAFVLVAPAIASVSRAPFNPVRMPKIEYRAIEALLRWIETEEDSRAQEV